MIITIDDAVEAMNLTAQLEVKMHQALEGIGENPLAPISKKISRFIKDNGQQTLKDLWLEFEGDVREDQLEECLKHLKVTGQIYEEITDVGGKLVKVYKMRKLQ